MLTFYDGDNTNGTPITQLNGFNFNDPVGGGGVCFQVQATSGCMTVQFQSDGDGEFEGWKAMWECSNQPCPQQEQMSVNTTVTPIQIVDAVSTPATVVTLTNIDCADGAYGTFSFPTDNNGLGLDKGLVLTSGDAQLTAGPNSSPASGVLLGMEGDEDLDYLSDQQGNGQLSFDACVVEFDVFVATNELSFEYVFGSDEYPEYVNSNFNDIFAFLVSGPGIVGDPGLGGALNIATLPGTNTPVQINSVNNLLNWQYFRNNEGAQTLSQVLEYDGLTSDSLGIKKSLTARTNVTPCNTYHLKLAVADRGDGALDSGVFMSKIQGGTPELDVQFASGIDYFIEDCSGSQDQLVISLSQPFDEVTNFIVTVGGTATLGTDYLLSLPGIITFQPGETSLSFPIVPIADNLVEGTETITVTLSNNFGCGTVVYKTLTVDLTDNVIVNVKGGDTLFVCAGATLQLQAVGAANFFWAPPGAVSNPFIGNPTVTPTQNLWLEVTGTISTCVDVDSVYIAIVDPNIDVVALSDTTVCQGTPVFIQANNNVNNTGLVWTPSIGLNNPNSPSPVATPSVTTTYTATVSIAGCSVSDQVTIDIDTLFFPVLTVEDTIVCQNYPVQLAEVLSTTTEYNWTPTVGLSDPTSSGPIALPDVSTVYTLVATSANAYCSQTASVDVTVVAADVDIEGDPYREICLGDTLVLTALSSPAGSAVTWSPGFYLSSSTGPSVLAFPDESVTIIATYNINNCIVYDSVRIRVDSLPEQAISRVEDKTIYCPGDTVYLISKTYEPANFPDIMIEWLPFSGQETPLDLWNMVITATTTHTFERIVTNRGCKDTATVEVPVAIPPTLIVDATPDQICPGGSSEILVTVDPPGTVLEWQDMPATLSCFDCVNPTAMPDVTTTYTVTTPEADCPSGASVTIVVAQPPTLNLAPNPVICPGESILLNNIAPEPGVTYSWTPSAGLDNPTLANPTATPTATTTYNVTATGPQCTSEGTVIVTVANATIEAGLDQTACFGDGVTLTAVTTGTPGIITWTPGNLPGSTVNVNPVPGQYVYTATLVFGNNCIISDELDLTIFPVPNLNLTGSTVICPGGSLQLNSITPEPGVTYS
ncbi:MAG: choice-of-anchor L domain-containing protein [Lewinellaceae bacterium]|nr:choice-of-anchor L domain-containing protein [Lewinellaceae bacterium]